MHKAKRKTENKMGNKKDGTGIDATAKMLFQISNMLVMPGWLAMGFAPESKLTETYIKGAACSIAVLYAFSLITGGSVKGGSFSTLKGVRNIFRLGSDRVVNGCWLHYLAFDMLVGYTMAIDAVNLNISKMIVGPFLFGTLMFGPAGWASFQALKLFIV